MYLVDWLYFLALEKWPFVGDIVRGLAAHCPLVINYILWGEPPMWVVWVLLLWQADCCFVGVSGPWSSWAPDPALCRHWVGGLGQEATGCGMPGVLGLVLAHWCRQTHVQGWVVMGLGFPAFVLACWLLESVLHSTGCGFHGVQS